MLFTKEWWRAALVRASKTFAQACVGALSLAVSLTGFDWLSMLWTALLAAVLSVMTSLAGLPELDGESYGFWRAAGVRALKTFFQTAISLIPAAATIVSVDWLAVLGASALAALTSFLTSLGGLPEVDGSSAK